MVYIYLLLQVQLNNCKTDYSFFTVTSTLDWIRQKMCNEITVESGHNKKLYIFAVYINIIKPLWYIAFFRAYLDTILKALCWTLNFQKQITFCL